MTIPGNLDAVLSTPAGQTEIRELEDPQVLGAWLSGVVDSGAVLLADGGALGALSGIRGFAELSRGSRERVLVLPPGEQAKSWTVLERILERLTQFGLGRDGQVLVLGGGAACDVGALAASLYMRGVSVVLVPTTLLAMVDAAIGGKTAIDFGEIKNLVGTFHPAAAVVTCPGLLSTLPHSLMRAGWAELVKAAFLSGGELLSIVEARDSVPGPDDPALSGLIRAAAGVKVRVVEEDFRESGIREHLNLGHSLGHALEALAAGSLSHGDAVAWGMERELAAGVRLGITGADWHGRVGSVLSGFGYGVGPSVPAGLAVSPEQILQRVFMDKKNRDGVIRIVLQDKPGSTGVYPVPPEVLLQVLQPHKSA